MHALPSAVACAGAASLLPALLSVAAIACACTSVHLGLPAQGSVPWREGAQLAAADTAAHPVAVRATKTIVAAASVTASAAASHIAAAASVWSTAAEATTVSHTIAAAGGSPRQPDLLPPPRPIRPDRGGSGDRRWCGGSGRRLHLGAPTVLGSAAALPPVAVSVTPRLLGSLLDPIAVAARALWRPWTLLLSRGAHRAACHATPAFQRLFWTASAGIGACGRAVAVAAYWECLCAPGTKRSCLLS